MSPGASSNLCAVFARRLPLGSVPGGGGNHTAGQRLESAGLTELARVGDLRRHAAQKCQMRHSQ